MKLFGSKALKGLGVDIGSSSIKAVELIPKGAHLELANYGIIDGLDFLGEKAPVPNVPSTLKMSEDEVAAILRRMLDFSKIESAEAFFSIPIFSSFLTTIELPMMQPKDLSRAIPFQARSYIPVPLEEVVLDWVILPPRAQSTGPVTSAAQQQQSIGTSGMNKQANEALGQKGGVIVKQETNKISSTQKPSSGKQMSVLLAAVPKEVIKKYERIAQKARLKIQSFEIESFSLLRSLVGNDRSTVMLIDFGARSTTLSLVDQGSLRISHTVDLSGKDITGAIARGLNVSLSRAEELKKNVGMNQDVQQKGIAELITPLLEKILIEFEKMSNSYLRAQQSRVVKVILSGGSASLPGLSKYLASRLNVPVSVGNPFARISYPKQLEELVKKELATTLPVAAGLAMRSGE